LHCILVEIGLYTLLAIITDECRIRIGFWFVSELVRNEGEEAFLYLTASLQEVEGTRFVLESTVKGFAVVDFFRGDSSKFGIEGGIELDDATLVIGGAFSLDIGPLTVIAGTRGLGTKDRGDLIISVDSDLRRLREVIPVESTDILIRNDL